MRFIQILGRSLLLFPFLGFAQYTPEDLYESARKDYYESNFVSASETIDRYLLTERTPEGFYLQSMILEALGENTRAIGALTEVLNMDGDHLDAFFKRGTIYFNMGIYAQAIRDFSVIINFDESESTNAIYFKLDQYGQEQVQVATLATMKGQVYGLRGLARQSIGSFEDAERDLTISIRMDSSAQNFVNRALLFMELGQTASAKNDLNFAIRLDPDLVIAWYNLMLLDPELELPQKVEEDAEFFPLVSYRAVEALQEGRLEEADILLTKALRIKGDDPLLLINAGRLKYRMKSYPESIAHFRRVLELDGSRFEAYYLAGNSFFQMGEFTQSAAFYEQYLARDMSNETVWYNAAMSYFELDDSVRGCECLQNAVDRGMMIPETSSLLNNCNQ